VTPLLLFGLGVSSVFGLERRDVQDQAVEDQGGTDNSRAVPESLSLLQSLGRLRSIPQVGRFTAVLCLFTFSMFLNDAVLESFGAAVFGMSICATTALNAFLAIGFFVGLGLSGFCLVDWIGNVSTARLGAVFAAIALALMLLSAPSQSLPFLHFALTIFGISLGICIHSSFTLMFTFVQPGRVGLLLGVWGALYAYSRGLATISGGGLLTLFETLNGGDVFGAYGGVFCLQIVGFLAAAVLMRRLDVTGFRRGMQSRFGNFMQSALD
jgi:BCD family chlorophyll transporter-like MFS transporter